MAGQPVRLTYADYLLFPDDQRWELIEGVPHLIASPNRRHQDIAGLLYATVLFFVREHGGGNVFIAPFDAVLTDIDVVQPDVVFVSKADAEVLTDDNIWGSPTWVVEVLSSASYERNKLRRYEAARVAEHWLIDPYQDTLAVSILEGSTYGTPEVHQPPALVRPRSLPGLEIDLGDLLRR